MDAAQTRYQKIVLFAVAFFFIAAGLQAQTFSNPGTVTVGLGGGSTQISGSGDPSSPITFTAALSNFQVPNGDPQNWVKISNGCDTSSCTTPSQLSFQILNLGVTQGTYTATVTLTASSPSGVAAITFNVTYTSGSNGGGGGGSQGTITATPSSVTLSSTPGSSNAQQTTVTLSTTSTTAISFTVTYTPTGSWLQVGTTNSFVTSGSSATLNVIASAFSLSNGTQTGTITVTPTNGGSATTIPVTFNVSGSGGGNGSITANPNPVNWNYTSNSGTFSQQAVTLSTSTGATAYNATVNSSNGWLQANGSTTTTGGNYSNGILLTMSGAVGSLITGNYTGTVNLTDSSSGTGTITVNLVVNGGTTSGLTITPSGGLTFTASVGGGQTATQTITVTSTVAGSLNINCSSTGWLQCSGIPSTIGQNSPTNITVSANAGVLTNGTYTGQFGVTVSPSGGNQLAGSVPVTFVVGTGGNGGGGGSQTGFAVAPSTLNFTYQIGTNRQLVPRATIGITGPAGQAFTINTTASWLLTSTVSGQFAADGTFSTLVSVDPTGQATGTYNSTVQVVSNGVNQNATVTLTVVNSAVLETQPGSLFFNYHNGDPALQPQSVNMVASDGSTVTATATTSTSWLTVSQTAGSTAFSVTANPGSLGSGMYTGTVTITQASLVNSPVTFPVVLVVNGGSSGGGGGGGGTLTLTPTVLTFNAALNGSNPLGQTITVTGGATGTSFSITTATQGGGNWLSTTQTTGVLPASIGVLVSSQGLGLGTYNGTVTFSSNGANQTVSVVLNVTSSGSGGGNVSTDKTSLTFSGQAGSSNLAAQTVNVTSTTGSPVAMTASASTTSGGNWLSVTASNTSTPSVLTVTATIGSLGAGTYNGSIVVAPTGGSAVTIAVTLTVTAPPTVSASPTSLNFSYRAGDQAPATQNISVTGGSGLTFTASASSNGNWLNVTPGTGTTPATLTVGVSPSSLSASNTPYTGTITVSGSGSATGTTTITVSLTVTAPLPTVSKVTNAGSFATSAAISPGEIITLFASDSNHPIGPSTPAGLTLDSTGKVATVLSGVQVLAGGYSCPLIYVSASQISAVVPYEVANLVVSGADVLVKYLGQSSNAVHVAVATTQPGLFTLNSSGTGPGAILNSNGSVNSPSNRAAKGDVVVIYMTGEGQTSPAGVTGKVTTVGAGPQFTPAPLLTIGILVGGQPANYIYAGEAPGFVTGVMQLNVVLPTTIASGDQSIVVSVGTNSSQQGVTVSVQ